MAKYYIFTALVVAMYGGLYWFSVGEKEIREKLFFLVSSLMVLLCLVGFMLVNLFYALFWSVLLLCVAFYISDRKTIKNGKSIKHGAFGGLWLSVPIYAYLATST